MQGQIWSLVAIAEQQLVEEHANRFGQHVTEIERKPGRIRTLWDRLQAREAFSPAETTQAANPAPLRAREA